MLKEKLNLKNRERVIIHGIGDGKEHPGVVLGKSFEHIFDSYIVMPDGNPFSEVTDFECVAIPECCLRREL